MQNSCNDFHKNHKNCFTHWHNVEHSGQCGKADEYRDHNSSSPHYIHVFVHAFE